MDIDIGVQVCASPFAVAVAVVGGGARLKRGSYRHVTRRFTAGECSCVLATEAHCSLFSSVPTFAPLINCPEDTWFNLFYSLCCFSVFRAHLFLIFSQKLYCFFQGIQKEPGTQNFIWGIIGTGGRRSLEGTKILNVLPCIAARATKLPYRIKKKNETKHSFEGRTI